LALERFPLSVVGKLLENTNERKLKLYFGHAMTKHNRRYARHVHYLEDGKDVNWKCPGYRWHHGVDRVHNEQSVNKEQKSAENVRQYWGQPSNPGIMKACQGKAACLNRSHVEPTTTAERCKFGSQSTRLVSTAPIDCS